MCQLGISFQSRHINCLVQRCYNTESTDTYRSASSYEAHALTRHTAAEKWLTTLSQKPIQGDKCMYTVLTQVIRYTAAACNNQQINFCFTNSYWRSTNYCQTAYCRADDTVATQQTMMSALQCPTQQKTWPLYQRDRSGMRWEWLNNYTHSNKTEHCNMMLTSTQIMYATQLT